ncbi:translation initiation factor SUI1, partial [Thamnocephalis sphaerospora]
IRVKQRNGRKCVTTIEGLPQDLRIIKRLVKDLKKSISVGGSIEQDDDVGYVIQLQGKNTTALVNHLVENYKEIDRSQIEVHGAV